jgi:hypothetical protein
MNTKPRTGLTVAAAAANIKSTPRRELAVMNTNPTNRRRTEFQQAENRAQLRRQRELAAIKDRTGPLSHRDERLLDERAEFYDAPEAYEPSPYNGDYSED